MSTLYRKQPGVQTRWASFGNPAGAKGQGGRENQGAKGHAFDHIEPGETKALLDVQGCGLIHRLWLTLHPRAPQDLRALRLEMYWDDAATPAVAVPLGDFFCAGLGLTAFENELFASPEGRSFIATVPMPFRTAARITLTNESDQEVPHLYYDINYSLLDAHADDVLYFHACWRRENPTSLGQDFTILPQVAGSGRFLGAGFSVITGPVYGGHWWGEGEVKVYLDGDGAYPTLAGTGAEDYIGTGWGQGLFQQRSQGSLVADKEKGWWSFYRFHVQDPIYFHQSCHVTIQVMGNAPKADLPRLLAAGAAIKVVSVDGGGYKRFTRLLDEGRSWDDPAIPDSAGCNYYRQDDWAAVAYFYLDAGENGLPPLAPVADRVAGLSDTTLSLENVSARLLQALYVQESLRAKDDGFAFNLQNPIRLGTITGFNDLVVDGIAVDPAHITLITMNGEVRPATAIAADSPLLFMVGTTLRVQVAGRRLTPGPHDLLIRLLVQENPNALEIAVTDQLGNE